jgi:putative ABC transport system permease protein
MSLLSIALKSIRQRLLASVLTGLSVALGVALMVAVLIINGVVSQMFSQSGSSYHLIVGPKGSDLQLVLSSVYRISPPIENLPWRFLKDLEVDKRVEMAIPIALGDTTEQGNFPIVGTYPQYFKIGYALNSPYQVRGDWLKGTWDAVIGSQVAQQNGWDIGATFRLIHSGQEEHVHEEEFTVKGVLAPTGTPNDRTVFVHLDGFFLLDSHDKPVDEAVARMSDFYGVPPETVREWYAADLKELEAHSHEGHDHEGHHHHPVSDLQKEVTAVFVVTRSAPNSRLPAELSQSIAAQQLQTELKKGFKAMGVNPIIVMQRLMQDLVGNIRLALLLLTGLIIAVSGIGIFVSIYNSMADRKREIAILRALGARRQTVFSVVLIESILLCVGGGLSGLLLGHGLVFIAAPIIAARSGGLLIDPYSFELVELVIIPAMIALASLVGFLPALTAYRTDVANALSS